MKFKRKISYIKLRAFGGHRGLVILLERPENDLALSWLL